MGLDNPVHILLLLLVLLLVFGAKRLPEMGRSLGEGMRGFKDSLQGGASSPERLGTAPVAVPERHDAAQPLTVTELRPTASAATERTPGAAS